MARAQKSPGSRKVRYAVVGLGYISQSSMLPAFAQATRNSELVALVSDDAVKARKLGKRYGAERIASYEQYDALLGSGEIDAVYIGLPNSMHRDFVGRAAKRGVHVLCEKPLGGNAREARAMVDACARAGVRLMTAYRLHFEPANLAAVQLASGGKLGMLRYFTAQFSMQVKSGNIRLDEELDGGPMRDIGIYCINAARNLFRAEPIEVVARLATRDDPRFTEVEEMASVVMRFPLDRFASFTCSFGAADASSFQLYGTQGSLRLDQAFEMKGPKEMRVEIMQSGGKPTRKQLRKFAAVDQFAPLLTHFSDCVLESRDPAPSGEEGLADLLVIDAVYAAARSGKPVRLKQQAVHGDRPDSDQAVSKPQPRKRALFRARAPAR